jgi:hypothetical protein
MNLKGEIMNRFSFVTLLVALFATSTLSQEPATAPTVPPAPTWKWTSSGKEAHASLKSESGNETIDLAFFKHELDTFRVLAPDHSIAMKVVGNAQGNVHKELKELKENKLPVTLTYDDGTSASKTWGVIVVDDNLAVAPRNDDVKEFSRAMKSKKFTISYTDVTGAVVTGIFNIGDIREQMKAHGVKIHKFGFGDALSLAAGAIPVG